MSKTVTENAPMDFDSWKKKRDAEREALAKKLPDNSVIEHMQEEADERKRRNEHERDFDAICDLVHNARAACCEDGEKYETVIADLLAAIKVSASQKKSKPSEVEAIGY